MCKTGLRKNGVPDRGHGRIYREQMLCSVFQMWYRGSGTLESYHKVLLLREQVTAETKHLWRKEVGMQVDGVKLSVTSDMKNMGAECRLMMPLLVES